MLISSMWFQNLFRDKFKLSEERSQAEMLENQSGGCMQAVSTGSKAMGRGGDFAICDGLNSADDVPRSLSRGLSSWTTWTTGPFAFSLCLFVLRVTRTNCL